MWFGRKFPFKGQKLLERIFKIHAKCFKNRQTAETKVDVGLLRGLAQFVLRNPHVNLTAYYAELDYEDILEWLKAEANRTKSNRNKRGVDQNDYRVVLETVFAEKLAA